MTAAAAVACGIWAMAAEGSERSGVCMFVCWGLWGSGRDFGGGWLDGAGVGAGGGVWKGVW